MHMLLANIVGSDGLIVILIALIVIFGGSQLPKIARNVGAAGKEFKKGQAESEEEARAQAAAQAIAPPAPQPVAPPAPQPVAAPQSPAPQPVATPQPPADAVTLSKAELDALIEQRLAQKDPSSN